jgi:parallel beta-helix repeat protein
MGSRSWCSVVGYLKRLRGAARRRILLVGSVALVGGAFVGTGAPAPVDFDAAATAVVDEVHYTFTGPTSVGFSWRGSATDIRYGSTSAYGNSAEAQAPSPLPFSSAGPFQQIELTGLQPGSTYHYSIGGGPDHTFTTAPTSSFRFDVEADIGSTLDYKNVGTVQNMISADDPSFVLASGDLTYAEPFGQPSVDQHFNDVMAWSQEAAYMPAWGNHEWENPSKDDLRNYKGRFMLPNPGTAPSAPAAGCCGEDWNWFDAGGVRFISYPEPYSSSTWSTWRSGVDAVFAAAQADPSIHFIVTFGHRPAYSTGFHPGETALAGVLNDLGDKYSKYVLNFNGHSHDYERFEPIHGVTHITAAGGGAGLEPPWSDTDSRTQFRALHLAHQRVDVSATGIRVDAICGPATNVDDIACVQGSVIDSYTIGTNPPPAPPPPPTLYVDKGNANCSDGGTGTTARPFCSIKPAASRVVAGQTVLVAGGTYNEAVTVSSSGTAASPVNFAAVPGDDVIVSAGSSGFTVTNKQYVNIQGFHVTKTTGDGIVVKNSSNVGLRGNRVSFSGLPSNGKVAKGIRLDGVTDSIVARNRVDHNTDYGIYLLSGSTRNELTANQVSDNARVFTRAAAGIRLYASPANTVSSNVCFGNEDSGLEFYTGSNNNLVVNNVSYRNGDHGIDNFSSSGQRIVANTVYDNVTAGINLEENSTGGRLANNISVDNGIDSPRTKSNIRVDSTSTSGASSNYNLVSLRTSGTMFVWGSTSYSSLAAFTASTGQERQGLQADPLFDDAAAGDLHLRAGSAAIDSADSGASGHPASDADGRPRLDDPSTPNTGAGPRRYDDRGAYEFEPEEPTDVPPSVSLTVTPSSGDAPLRIVADASGSTDTDNSPIDSYRFDFGDGTVTGPQTSPTAAHTYQEAGAYTLKVTVTDTEGLASSSTVRVTAHDAPPSAALSVTPSSGAAPLAVTADASGSTDPGSTPIDTYNFDFGDGTVTGTQHGATAQHTYSDPGQYTVKVTVTDTAGNSSTATTQVTVNGTVDTPPSAALTVTPPSGTAPLEITADASGSSDTDSTPIESYTFDFGDHTGAGPGPAASATHTYEQAGTYTVKVTVTDTAGLSSSATTQLTVDPIDAPPAAALTVSPSSGTAPLAVSADASRSTDGDDTPIETYEFDFGDGTVVGPQASASADHTYRDPGTYTVKVTVTDTAGLSAIATSQVTISPLSDAPPSATVTVTPGSGSAPLAVTADASGSTDTDQTPIESYKFDFGDGTVTGAQSSPTAGHTYQSAGTYTVKVTVKDTAGLSAVATTQVTVTPPDLPPSAALTVSPGSGVTPLSVTADASASTDGDDTPIASFRFNFGDGTAIVGPQASAVAAHTYPTAGVYTITVTVTDTAGQSSVATAQVTAFGNLVGNPGFETDLSGWNTSGSGSNISLTRVSGGRSGTWAAKLTNTGTTASTATLNDSPDWAKPSAAGTYTGTLWVRGDTAGATIKLRFREYAGSSLVGTVITTATLTTSWQQVAVTYTPQSPGASTIDFNAYVSSAAPGTAFYADDAAIFLN